MSFSKLDQPMIVREALALLAESGLAQVSLRKVAARLDVGVSSLYWHVKDRDTLFRLMSQTIYRSCLQAVPESRTWRQWLEGFGLTLWEAQWTIRDARQLIASASLDEAAARQTLQQLAEQLKRLGLPEALGALAVRSVQALVTGWTTLESKRSGPRDKAAFTRALGLLLDGIAGEAPDSIVPSRGP